MFVFLIIVELTKNDKEYINQRVCGVGHPLTNDCIDHFNTTNLSSIHLNRKRCLDHIESMLPNKSEIIIFEAKDSDNYGNNIKENTRKIMDKQPGII